MKELCSFLYEPTILGNDAEAAAVFNVEIGEIERQKVEFLAVHQHHLAVVTDQIIRGAGNSYALFQKPHFQLAQILFPTLAGIGDQCVYGNTTLYRVFQSPLKFTTVQAENDNLDCFLSFVDTLEQRGDAVVGLYAQRDDVRPQLIVRRARKQRLWRAL